MRWKTVQRLRFQQMITIKMMSVKVQGLRFDEILLACPCPCLLTYQLLHLSTLARLLHHNMALWTKFCGEDGSPHDPNHFECPSCGALNPRAAVAAAPRAAVAPRPPPGPPSGPPPRPGSYDIIDVDAARTRPSAVTVASASSLHIVPESAKPAGFPVHFFLHYFDFVGGVRLYTRLQGQGMNNEFFNP
jgi:hypothetical protein